MVEFYILCVVFIASLLSVTFEFHNLACDLEDYRISNFICN